MLLDQEIYRIIDLLTQDNSAEVKLGCGTVTIQILDDGGKLILTTTVFKGSDYIPPSVRASVAEELPGAMGSIRTFLKIDEEAFTIVLHYLGVLVELDPNTLKKLLEEFVWQADEWRLRLDERGRDDLIHIPT